MVESRLSQLKKLVEQQEREFNEAAASYRPKTTAGLEDLTAAAEDILRLLPGVCNVKVAVQADKPTHRIIHLRDWHFVPRDLFAIDVKHAASRPLSEEVIDRLYEEGLLEVEAMQLEQLALFALPRPAPWSATHPLRKLDG